MIFREWAAKWGVPMQAILDYEKMTGEGGAMPEPNDDAPTGSENRQQSLIRIEAAHKGISLFRNNVGALVDSRGVPVRYGLANESKQMNQRVKSGDLIGIDPVLITANMIGQTIGRFISVEVKKEGWTYSDTPHEQAQRNWISLVNAKGGRALFANRSGLL